MSCAPGKWRTVQAHRRIKVGHGRPYLTKGRNDVNFFITVAEVQIPKRTA